MLAAAVGANGAPAPSERVELLPRLRHCPLERGRRRPRLLAGRDEDPESVERGRAGQMCDEPLALGLHLEQRRPVSGLDESLLAYRELGEVLPAHFLLPAPASAKPTPPLIAGS